MKKFLIMTGLALFVLGLFATPAIVRADGGLVYHNVQIVDELGRKRTDVESITIRTVGTTDSQTIYKDRALANAITQPITDSSANTTLDGTIGVVYWWGDDSWDYTITTDGGMSYANNGHMAMDASSGQIVFPSYVVALSSTTYGDSNSITMGTDSDWVIRGGLTAGKLEFRPAANGSLVTFGLSDGTLCSDLWWYTASGVGLNIDEGADTLAVTGLTTSINTSSNYATNINTGTSTGAVTIGGSGAQTITIGDTGIETINIGAGGTGAKTISIGDGASTGSITLSSGTGDLALVSTDDITLTVATAVTDNITITNTAGTAADAIKIIASAGGVDIDAVKDIAITTTSGSAADDILITQTGANDSSITLTAAGTGSDAIGLIATAGGMVLTTSGATDNHLVITSSGTSDNALQITTTAGGIELLNGGAATEDIDITSTSSSINLTATEAAADQIKISAAGTVAGNAVNIATTDGGIILTATGAANGDIAITAANTMVLTADPTIQLSGAVVLNTVETFADSDATPDVSGATYWNTNTTTFTITDFDGTGIAAGQLLIVTSKGAITYDVTSSGILGGSTDIVTAAGDVTTFIYDGTDWLVVARMNMSDDLN